MISEHYTAAVVIATRFNLLALIIRWSTKEVTKRPFKIVCIFSCKLWRNELLLLLTLEVVITNHLWSIHLFLKLNFLDFILVFWREDTLGTGILVSSWIPDWQRRRGALELLLTLFCSLPSDMFSFYRLRHQNSTNGLFSEVCTFIKLILEGRPSKTGIRLPRQKLHEVNSFFPLVFILIFIILLIHVNFSSAK